MNTKKALPISSFSLTKEQQLRLDDIFSADGILAQNVSSYQSRHQQIEMARKITEAINQYNILIAEAGTGTGKTFAYLIPALLWGGKVIISTGTKTLQDQLYERDLPKIRAALQMPVNIALLKGRANYLCHYYLQRAQHEGLFSSKREASYLQRIISFIHTTQSGDKAESGIPEEAQIWNQVTSTRENCLGHECSFYKDCFVAKARKQALEADIIVVNHHLFFADLALRDGGITELLPTANTVIFDEAHQLPDTASQFFSETISSSQLFELARDSLIEGRRHARDGADWAGLTAAIELAVRNVRLFLGEGSGRWAVSAIPRIDNFTHHLKQLTTSLQNLLNILEDQSSRSETLALCYQRTLGLQEQLHSWQNEESYATIRWVETTLHTFQLHRTPLDVATTFSRHREGRPRAWIFTSATLAIKQDFQHYARQLGLEDAATGYWDSPFDYATQGLLYIPQKMPAIHSEAYFQALFTQAWPLIEATQGGVFFLCTTLRAVDKLAELLQQRLMPDRFTSNTVDPIRPLFIQGQASRTVLLEKFRQSGQAILVGSQSFWQGVDVVGLALSLVIIDKLPFAPPDDPVLAARTHSIEQAGGNPFIDYQLPQAIISLKQGAGRLIRSESDRGVLMVGDTRLVDKPYGRLMWQSLPPFKRTRIQQEALDFILRRDA